MTKEELEALRARRLKRPVARLQDARTDWYRVQAKADETPKIYIYDEIGYWGDSAKSFTDELNKIDSTELVVHLNSPGGEIFDGLAIYQALKNHKARVTIVVDGLAASIASVIAMAADRLIMAPKATLMIHDGWTMGVGNAAELRKLADLLDKQSEIIASAYADRTGQPTDFWRDRMRDETWYNAEEALAAGLIDEIEGQEKKTDEAFDLGVFAHAGRVTAPEPVIKAEIEEPAILAEPAVEPKVEVPFTWDFEGFKSSLKEGING